MHRYEDSDESLVEVFLAVMEEHFPQLQFLKFKLIFDLKQRVSKGRLVLASIETAGPKIRYLSKDKIAIDGYDLLLIVDQKAWEIASAEQRVKLIRHELRHVQIDEKGSAPKIEPIKTGQLTWASDEFEMRDSSSLTELKDHLESIKEIDLVRLVLFGELPLESKEELDNILEFQTTVHKNFRVKLESLDITATTELEEQIDLGDPTLNETEKELRELLADEADPKKRRVIAEALIHLQRFGKDVEV